MENNSGVDKPAYVIVATYKFDRLTGVGTVPYTFTAENTTATAVTDVSPDTANMTVKAFVWEGEPFGVPITNGFHLYTWDNSTGSFAGGIPSITQ